MIRKARLEDVVHIYTLITAEAKKGRLIPLSISEIYESIRDFCVAVFDDNVVGCSALKIFSSDLAEIRSVAVSEDYRGRGLGKELVLFCIEEARAMGIDKVFVLTLIPEFFKSMGFEEVDKSSLPQKVWRDCIKCAKFPECDEVSLIFYIKKGG